MQKYAFIENVPGLTADNYMDSFNDGEWISYVIGLDGMDKVVDCAKQMIAGGASLINLCGDFGPEHVDEIMKDAPEGTEVHFAAYLPEELAKLEALAQYVEYGQIIFGGVEDPVHLELKDPAMNTHTVFIKDLDQAIATAQDFAKAGVDGIELCSSFDLDMTKQIIAAVEAIDPKIPVGSNGITV
ncbi:MAG: hypothetical protein IJ128_03130 [Firmicutes bacterium]|nr:hypothetical protein [Bacillota bacterium]